MPKVQLCFYGKQNYGGSTHFKVANTFQAIVLGFAGYFNVRAHAKNMRMIIPRKVLGFFYQMSLPTKYIHTFENRERHFTDL